MRQIILLDFVFNCDFLEFSCSIEGDTFCLLEIFDDEHGDSVEIISISLTGSSSIHDGIDSDVYDDAEEICCSFSCDTKTSVSGFRLLFQN